MRKTSLLLALLVLGSGALLLAAALVSLAEAVRTGDLRARAEAQRVAGDVAEELRERLADVRVLARLPAERRFAVAAGELVVPPEVGWIGAAPADPAAALPWGVAVLLERARQAAFAAGDAAAAERLYAEALVEVRGAPGEGAVLARAAWHARRAGETEVCAERLAQLDARAGELAPATLASALLLHAAVDGVLPAWAEARFGTLPPERARVVLELLGAHGIGAAELARLAAVSAHAAAQRAVLQRAARHVPGMLLRGTPSLVHAPPDVVLLFPRQEGTGAGAVAGEGAVVTAEVLAGALRPRAAPWTLAFGGEASLPGAAPVWPGVLAVVPADVAGAPGWLGPSALGGLLIVLAACFALGVVLAFRGLRREHEAVRARAEFLTSVTHELKTPLASIRLLAEMLDEGRVRSDAQRRAYFRLLAGESVRLTVLIENVLDLGRIERGERGYDRRPLAPADVLREATELFAPVGKRDGLDVTLGLDAAPARIVADRGALVQALLNVMDNARKYAAAGGVLAVEGRRNGRHYHVVVRDRGPGIAPHERGVVFERFRRGARQADGSTPGVGLGLYLARSIARAHGGELVCEDPDGGGPGCSFRFTLPLQEEGA